MRPIGASECVAGLTREFALHFFQVGGREDHIAVEDEHILSFGMGNAIVARRAGAAVFFVKITYREAVCVSFHYAATVFRRTIFHDHDFKVRQRLCAEALQEFLHFGRAVVDGDDKGILH